VFDDRLNDGPSGEGGSIEDHFRDDHSRDDHSLDDHSLDDRIGDDRDQVDRGQLDRGQVTVLLDCWRKGDEQAFHKLIPLIYKELRRLAHYYLRSERSDHVLQSTALVHEAYLRLNGGQQVPENRSQFMAVASRAMRQVLVDYARSRDASKRDGGIRIDLEHVEAMPVNGDAEIVALNDALDELSRIDDRQAKIVEMRFFGGLSAPEISEALGISRATVDRDWAVARVWLHRQMSRTA
jgi:RNA polymerase sigma factor (TIGR02999 family)